MIVQVPTPGIETGPATQFGPSKIHVEAYVMEPFATTFGAVNVELSVELP